MGFKKILVLLCAIISVLVLLAGCSANGSGKSQNGLQITDMSTALGAVGDSLDKTKFSYTMTVYNKDNEDVYITWVEPILGENVRKRLISSELKVDVEQTVSANESIEIKGEIILDTKGMSKQQVMELEPFITGIKVSSEKIIDFDWIEKKKE
ncbi:hypothetical protein [Thermosediminibacter litoriperuensis]|uniref:Lipoprotein n=1 Tax=Thermosediminibacter litoriperuensis TaxID=291989 RepID=A0A5S5AEX5_9FIRM|nr:hypothetical protein [Thermosediminibacter litoriperuensis]TYP47666.1 hypothetical protein LZ11_02410 [Thermosediminibacter litoriperuensis]